MPGWGHGPWGYEPYGHWKWSEQVLYDQLPELQKNTDQSQQNGILNTYVQGLRPSFDDLLNGIQTYDNLRDPLKVRTQYDETSVLRLGQKVVTPGTLYQYGGDGRVDAFLNFISSTARFSDEDTGRLLTITKSTNPANNLTVSITKVLDPTTVRTYPPLFYDTGPITWSLRALVPTSKTEVTVQIESGNVSAIRPNWQLTDGYASYPVSVRTQLASTTEREGEDGTINSLGQFFAAGGRFSVSDTGKKITITGSVFPSNNGKFEITKVFSATTATLSETLTQDVGPLTWAVLPFPTLTISGGTTTLRGFVEQNGFDLQIDPVLGGNTGTTASYSSVGATPGSFTLTGLSGLSAPVVGSYLQISGANTVDNNGVFEIVAYNSPTSVDILNSSGSAPDTHNGTITWMPTAILTTQSGTFYQTYPLSSNTDVGKYITILGSSATRAPDVYNDSTLLILVVPDPHRLVVPMPTPPLVTESGLTWECRSSTAVGDNTQVSVAAPSLISLFAPDFGITVDTQESEARQRSWVANVNQWIGLKGTPDAYRILGLISGFNIIAENLYKIGPDIIPEIPTEHLFEVGDSNPNRSGSDGTLTASGFQIQLQAPSALFRPADTGNYILIENAANPLLNTVYDIDTFVNQSTVLFTVGDSTPVLSLLPDLNNGLLRWFVVSLYTDLPPLLPRFDDVREDEMEEIVSPAAFSPDTYAWSPTWNATVNLNILTTTFSSAGTFLVTVTGPADLVVGPDANLGSWQLTDALGTVFYLETTPAPLSGPLTGTAASITTAGVGSGNIRITGLAGIPASPTVVGNYLHLAGADSSTNNGTFQITAYNSATSVDIHNPAGIYSDSNSGAITWSLYGSFTFNIIAAASPALGLAKLTYLPRVADGLSCNYCAASKVLCVIEAASIASDPVEQQLQALTRVLNRLQDVVPAHVELVPRYLQRLNATLSLSCTITADIEIQAELIAPVTGFYDTFAGDVITPTDLALYATVNAAENSARTASTATLTH